MKGSRLAIVAIIAAVMVGACAPPAQQASAPTKAAAACPAAGVTELLNGADPTFRPVAFQEGGNFVGVAPELGDALAQKMGIQHRLVGVQFDGIIPALQSDKINLISFLAITDARKAQVDFTNAWFKAFVTAVLRADDTRSIKSITDLRGLKLAVQGNSSAANVLAKEPGLSVTQYNAVEDEYNELILGRVDAVIIETTNAGYTASKIMPGKLKVTNAVIGEPYTSATAVKKGNAALLDALNCAVKAIQGDGTLDKIIEKWYGKIDYRPGG